MEPSRGLIVCAMAGRERGRYFVVTKAEGTTAYIADGKTRKLSSPKKKNVKHLRTTSKTIALTQITDKKLRGLLKEFTEQNPDGEVIKVV